MMKQRRRMLMSQQDFYYDNLFKSASYIVSDGNDSKTTGTAQFTSSLLLSGIKYYLFAFCNDAFAIFSCLNTNITKLYQNSSDYTLAVTYAYPYYKLSVNGNFSEKSFGVLALTFEDDMDDVFLNFKNGIGQGITDSEFGTRYINYLSVYPETQTRYLFVGTGWDSSLNDKASLCIYKITGASYDKLDLLFSHSLTLLASTVSSCRVYSAISESQTYAILGYTCLSVRM